MTEAEFIDGIKARCKELGVRLYLGKGKTIRCGSSKVSGYFDDTNRVLAVATGRKDWVEILSHESSHMDQWHEGCDEWKKLGGSCVVFDEWLEGKEMPKHLVRKHAMAILKLELDCERRSIKKLRASGLRIDLDRYIRKANSYLFLYHWLLVTRKWPKKFPYSNPKIYGLCSNRFLKDYSTPPKRLMEEFRKRGV
jgi:hypothetical protein